MRCFVIMGVAGCGKSSVGAGLSDRGLLAYVDGDTLHPKANVAKMSAGIALGDADRLPWLAKVGETLRVHDGVIAVGCSALKRSYRDLIRRTAQEPVGFLHLTAERRVIAGRIAARENHFMPTALLASQFADLEPLCPDEDGGEIDIAPGLDQVVAAAEALVQSLNRRDTVDVQVG